MRLLRMFASTLLLPIASGLSAAQSGPSAAQAGRDAEDLTDSPAKMRRIDAAVERGLGSLARDQMGAGCWTGDVGHKQMSGYVVFHPASRQAEEGTGHVGVTALAGLAFLADGHLPGQGRYGPLLDHLIDYLLRRSSEFGYLTDSGTRMYSHAFATLFLSQVHGMTGDRSVEVESCLRRAVEFIEETQNEHGGWRYSPFTYEADLSVTVCQVQALRAARNAGIHVSPDCIDRVVEYLRSSRVPSGEMRGMFYYKIYGRGAYTKTSFAINAAAATSMHSAGLYSEREYGPALDYVEHVYRDVSASYPDHYFFWYGNYYAAQALHMEGGRRWVRYWHSLSEDLLERQSEDGRWDNPVGPGSSFSTAVACLLLRLPAQYLPIFQR